MRTLVVVAHGSRSAAPAVEFGRILDDLRSRGDFDAVEGAYMEFLEPGLDAAVEALASKGADDITVVPFMLFPGVHAKKDIPSMLAALAEKHPGVKFRIAPPIGYDPLLAGIILDRASGARPLS